MARRDQGPRWRQHLTADERELVAALDRAIDMHRELMAPLFAERQRVAKAAGMRVIRAGAQQQSDAA